MVHKSDVPFGSEFSPSQIELIRVLALAKTHGTDWHALEDDLCATYFAGYKTNEHNRRKLANNCKLGMIAYGIISRSGELTSLGEELLSLSNTPEEMYERLARHILLDLKGLAIVQTVQDMHVRGEAFSLGKLRVWLEERSIHFPRGGRHPSTLRLWLEKAGIVVSRDWRVDQERLEKVIGASSAVVDELALLSGEQKAYLMTLANIGGDAPQLSNDIERMATTVYGVRFDEKNLPKTVLYPLRDSGYISLERGTKQAGRGAKPFRVRLTCKADAKVVAPLIKALEDQAAPGLRAMLRKPLADVLAELESDDRHVKGMALEALGFYLMRLIDLRYVATRLRGDATGGAEVDLVFEGARLVFSRWQVQCKNTGTVSLDDVAKEVGLTFQLKSNVVMVVSTGTIGQDARRYANTVMSSTNLNVVLLDADDLIAVAANPTMIEAVLNREAASAMKIKTLEVL